MAMTGRGQNQIGYISRKSWQFFGTEILGLKLSQHRNFGTNILLIS
jgi:hypothetical protein